MNEDAVSDVLGSVLLVGVTVILMGSLGFLLMQAEGPDDPDRASISLSAEPGANGWGTGDESFKVRHAGGEPVPTAGATVVYSINGVPTVVTGAALDGDWADGVFSIGDAWTQTIFLSQSDDLEVRVVQSSDASRLLASARVRGGLVIDCTADLTPPTVAAWTQIPSDIEPSTTGVTLIDAQVADACSGPNDSVVPKLEYRFDGGAWTDNGVMSLQSPHKWRATVPDLGWSGHDGELFEYRVNGMADNEGNTGNSAIQNDQIGVPPSYSYVASYTEIDGTAADFANMQAADDGNAESTLTQSDGVYILYGSDGTDGNGATNELNALLPPDDLWAEMDTNDEHVIVRTFDASGIAGSITKVEVLFEAHYTEDAGSSGHNDDGLDLDVYEGGSWQELDDSWPFQEKPGSTPYDAVKIYDITSKDASWSTSDIDNLRLRGDMDVNGDDDKLTFYLDAMYVRVTAGSGDALDVQLDWNDLPAGSLGELEIRYQDTGDAYHVEVWDGSAWNTRGANLDSAGWATWTYTLVGSELEPSPGTGPRIRIVDNTPGSTPGTIEIDYARVKDT